MFSLPVVLLLNTLIITVLSAVIAANAKCHFARTTTFTTLVGLALMVFFQLGTNPHGHSPLTTAESIRLLCIGLIPPLRLCATLFGWGDSAKAVGEATPAKEEAAEKKITAVVMRTGSTTFAGMTSHVFMLAGHDLIFVADIEEASGWDATLLREGDTVTVTYDGDEPETVQDVKSVKIHF